MSSRKHYSGLCMIRYRRRSIGLQNYFLHTHLSDTSAKGSSCSVLSTLISISPRFKTGPFPSFTWRCQKLNPRLSSCKEVLSHWDMASPSHVSFQLLFTKIKEHFYQVCSDLRRRLLGLQPMHSASVCSPKWYFSHKLSRASIYMNMPSSQAADWQGGTTSIH